MLRRVIYAARGSVVLSLALHPYTHSHTAYYKGQKVLTAYYPRLSMWHVWGWYFCSLPDIKTHIWIRCDGCIITTMTSHPIDKTDGRQDSWQHGTKLVWAAVPSVVCCHDRGGSYYLHGCPPSLPGWTGAGQWGGVGGLHGYPGNERMDWSGPSLASPQLPLSLVAGRLDLLIEL